MPPRQRPKPRALNDTQSGHSDDIAAGHESDDNKNPSSRLARKAKTKAYEEHIWTSAAPKGPKIRDAEEPRQAQAPRKRAASTAQQSSRTKAPKTNQAAYAMEGADDTDLVRHAPPKKRAARNVVDSDDELDKAAPTRPQPKRKRHSQDAPMKIPVNAEDTAFEEEDHQSDTAMGDADDEEDGEDDLEDEDDLQGLHADEVKQRLADSIPQWSIEDHQDIRMPSRSSSRSSGRFSIPGSTVDSEPIEVSSDSDSDSDPNMRAAFSSMKAAHQHVPAPKKTHNTASRHKGPSAPSKTSTSSQTAHRKLDLAQMAATGRGRTLDPGKPQGKREAQRAQERPEWRPAVSASRERSHSRHPSAVIKREFVDTVLDIKSEPEDTVFSNGDPNNIDLRRNNRNTVNLTKQHPDVQSVLGLAIDYFLGFYMLKCAYPDLTMKTTFSQDALIRAARDLKLLAIQNRLPQDPDYRSGLSTVLLGRVSIWRGKVKAAALQIVFGHYSVRHDCAALVARLLDKQAFIYPFKPDKRDLKTNEIVYGKPDNKRPYEHKGVPAVVSCFFKGPNSIAERVEAMFVRNSAGNLEASKSMVALACTGIWGVLDDYATGEHKPTDFDGSRVQDVYDVHIMLLEKLEAKNAEQYRTLMEDIFNTASRGSQFAKGVKVPTVQQQEALSMLDWSD